ncbi:MAG: hypothetical protein JWR19_2638 [Pedosphaera sp.]|nr:hypothetical protein [Pedosphaera sp.]
MCSSNHIPKSPTVARVARVAQLFGPKLSLSLLPFTLGPPKRCLIYHPFSAYCPTKCINLNVLKRFDSGDGTFLQRASSAPPPWRLLPESFFIASLTSTHHFPMQNWLKIESSKSSVLVFPTISPTAFTAIRKSIATNSSILFDCNASTVRCVAMRARFNASW